MLTIEVKLLTGRYVATAHDDRRRAEWPPHPARFFSALVAALYEGAAPPNAEEREALLWLERQPPPSLEVVLDAAMRDVPDVFVPVNDITVVGDIEEPVRKELANLARLESSGASAADVKRAAKRVEQSRAVLAEKILALGVPDEKPSALAIEDAAALLPDRRTRQVRTFPVAVPSDPNFSLLWVEAAPTHLTAALSRLCDRVTRLGHSSSLVWCRVTDRRPQATLVPTTDGEFVLRTVGPGQLERLDQAWARHQGVESRILPAMAQRYGRPPDPSRRPVPVSAFSDQWILFQRTGGSRPMSSRATDLAGALRASLLEQHGTSGMPSALSGHEPDGSPTRRPHLAFVALPYVGEEHADGSIQGCAIIPPREFADADRTTLRHLIAQWEATRGHGATMQLGADGLKPVDIERVDIATKVSVRPSRWCQPSKRFVTATPIALDRNPGNLRSNLEHTAHKAALEAQESIANACVNIGLPRPIGVEVSFAPMLQGAQSALAFRPQSRPGRPPRVRVHAEILFSEEVRGPVLLGSGRHVGLGLCLPIGGVS